MASFELALVTISSIIAVMEPFSTIAVYATITKRFDSAKKDKTISRSMLLSLIVLVFFALTASVVQYLSNYYCFVPNSGWNFVSSCCFADA